MEQQEAVWIRSTMTNLNPRFAEHLDECELCGRPLEEHVLHSSLRDGPLDHAAPHFTTPGLTWNGVLCP